MSRNDFESLVEIMLKERLALDEAAASVGISVEEAQAAWLEFANPAFDIVEYLDHPVRANSKLLNVLADAVTHEDFNHETCMFRHPDWNDDAITGQISYLWKRNYFPRDAIVKNTYTERKKTDEAPKTNKSKEGHEIEALKKKIAQYQKQLKIAEIELKILELDKQIGALSYEKAQLQAEMKKLQ